ncbi:MAG TPA: hypothetical protein VF911_02045, partial [Thermoanaerobaculia bacterium]
SGSLLFQVDSPVGIWRKYEYPVLGFSPGPLGVVRDGQHRLIESHDYKNFRNGKTSLQQNDDITEITRGEEGRMTTERKSRVTYKSGRVETYYQRFTGGRWRVVEIDGGCSSCGSGSSVTAYSEQGEPLRIQDGDGYITTIEYGATSGQVIKRRTALKPATCDPATAVDRCRQLPDALATVELVETSGSVITNYEYNDSSWPDRPTEIRTTSVLQPAQSKKELLTYDSVTGQVLTRSTVGWTGTPAREETRTITTTLYNGVAAAAFTPGGGTFIAAWVALPQPKGLTASSNGPRTDVVDVTSYVYYPVDASVPALLRGRLAAVKNAAGHVSLYEDYDIHGSARKTTSPNGVVQTSTYDALGRLTSAKVEGVQNCDVTADPLCTTALTSARTYDGTGPLLTETQPGGAATVYTYDDRRRVSTVSRGPSTTDLQERIETTYDPDTGRRSVEKKLRKVSGAWVEATRESFHYDTFGRLDEVTHADDAKAAYTYDSGARIASVRDENHTTANTRYGYDPAGRLMRVDQTLGTGLATTKYAYDIHGNLIQVTDPNGNVTSYVYDDFGQMLRQTSPVTGVTTYQYDVGGNLLTTTAADRAVTTRTFDILGRVLTSVATRGQVTESTSWTYDAGAFGKGRLSSMTDPTGSTEYKYDRRGLLISERKTIGGTVYVTAFGHDANGNRSTVTYPSGRVVSFTHDYAGRPATAASGGVSLVTSTSYLPFGPMTELMYGNGTVKTMEYDARYRLLNHRLTGSAGNLAQYAYTHDAAGNITAIQDVLDPSYNRTFAYDDLHRLVTANSGSSLWGNGSYTYDAMGNMKSLSLGAGRSATFVYSGTTPKLLTATENGVARSVAYDWAGNEA